MSGNGEYICKRTICSVIVDMDVLDQSIIKTLSGKSLADLMSEAEKH